MKGGPACGSERDITGKSMFCSPYFIIGEASLLVTGGEAAFPLIKQGNFRSCYGAKLQLYIMQLSLSLSAAS